MTKQAAAPLLLLGALLLPGGGRHPPSDVRFETDARGISLRAFVNWAAPIIGAATYAPAALRIVEAGGGRIVVERAVTMPRDRVLPFVLEMLRPHDLTLVRMEASGRALWLVESLSRPTVLARQTTFVPAAEIESRRFDPAPIVTVLALKRVSLPDVRDELEELRAGPPPAGGTLIAVESLNAFLVKGPGPDVFALLRLVESLDRVGGRKTASPPALGRRLAALEARVSALERARR